MNVACLLWYFDESFKLRLGLIFFVQLENEVNHAIYDSKLTDQSAAL